MRLRNLGLFYKLNLIRCACWSCRLQAWWIISKLCTKKQNKWVTSSFKLCLHELSSTYPSYSSVFHWHVFHCKLPWKLLERDNRNNALKTMSGQAKRLKSDISLIQSTIRNPVLCFFVFWGFFWSAHLQALMRHLQVCYSKVFWKEPATTTFSKSFLKTNTLHFQGNIIWRGTCFCHIFREFDAISKIFNPLFSIFFSYQENYNYKTTL